MKTISKILVVIGTIGLIIGIGIYFFKTKTIEVQTNPLTIDKATYSIKQSSWNFSSHYYAEEQVLPTTTTHPNTKYLLVIDFSLFKLQNKVSWNQLEIDIHKEKLMSNEISKDEYTALIQHPNYLVNIYVVKPEHQMLYIVPGLIILVFGIVIFIRSIFNSVQYGKSEFPYAEYTNNPLDTIKKKDGPEQHQDGTYGDIVFPYTEYSGSTDSNIKEDKLRQNKDNIPVTKIRDYIKIALEAMDSTHKWYTDENEGTRELVTALISMGLKAVYQPYLGNGITADAKVGEELIEAKLEPRQTDINNLIGQLQGYSRYNYKINVIIYGRLNEDALERIQDVINLHYKDKVFLIYLPNPKRTRKTTE